MEQHDLLQCLSQVAEELGLSYMITGSQATIVYGEARFTNDIDVVIDLSSANIEQFCDRFPVGEYYLSRPAAREAVAAYGMFNIIHPGSGLKIDVIVPKASGFDQERLKRARNVKLEQGFTVRMTSPEDIILKKLEWRTLGGGERHLQDIAGILKVSWAQLDVPYIERNADSLGVRALWNEVARLWRRPVEES
jgi:hypothetical protein